jgi:hypothetical protein
LALLINTFYTKRFVDYGMFEQLKDISVILLTSIVLTGIGILLMDEVANQYLQIVVIIFMIGSLYLISMYYLNRKLFLDNLDIVKNKISKNKKQ